jgi:PIN domain nuclease of toxin-antitoxin system
VKLLLDTHAILWWATASPSLSERAGAAIDDPANQVLVSAASVWEIATKVRIGRLVGGERVLLGFDEFVRAARVAELPITARHAGQAGGFEVDHRDPFDRMLAAQASIEGAALVTRDPVFAAFPVTTYW